MLNQKSISTKHNQHFLPRLYLRGFSDEAEANPFIWMYTKGKPFVPGRQNITIYNPVRLSTKTAAAIWDNYAFTRDDGSLDTNTIENELEKLEKPSDRIFSKIREKRAILNDAEKAVFASYITLTHRRVPARTARAEEAYRELVNNNPTLQKLRSELRSLEFLSDISPEDKEQLRKDLEQSGERLEELEECRDQVAELLDSYEKPRPEILLKSMVLKTEQPDFTLSKMTWRFLIAPENTLIFTGDNPVYISENGLDHPTAELTFPISRNILLHASWDKGPEIFLPISGEYTRRLNRRTAEKSRQIFASRSESELVRFFNRT